MDWLILILFFGFLLLMFFLIGMLLYSLAMQGDERKNFIKAKSYVLHIRSYSRSFTNRNW
ncbi:hypothetical protein J2Z64_003837 [Oceanobacillus polygoni]|uniref:Uncharacterized protein n=1 Tax=Oceanobacillus polygoni TaxID=1235259 RepID=A0A9X1CD89_9BACI|nr:hypothetical protein [Oceanobacillus polygoni]